MTPLLETGRLVLRALRLEDYPAHAAMWADPRTTRLFGSYIYDEELVWLRFLRHFGQWQLFGHGSWGVEERQSGRLIGLLGLFNAHRAMEIAFCDMPEAGWVLHPDFHGQGLALEGMQAVMAWADRHVESPQTWCMIAPQNLASQKTAARLGYVAAPDSHYKGERILTFLRPRGAGA